LGNGRVSVTASFFGAVVVFAIVFFFRWAMMDLFVSGLDFRVVFGDRNPFTTSFIVP
jgi:uncharacterized protein HemY